MHIDDNTYRNVACFNCTVSLDALKILKVAKFENCFTSLHRREECRLGILLELDNSDDMLADMARHIR